MPANIFLRGEPVALVDPSTGTYHDLNNPLPVGIGAKTATASLSNVSSAATSAQMLAANSARTGVLVYNDDDNPAFLKYGTTASSTSYTVRIEPFSYWEMPQPIYTGRIDIIWEADGSGAARVTEL